MFFSARRAVCCLSMASDRIEWVFPWRIDTNGQIEQDNWKNRLIHELIAFFKVPATSLPQHLLDCLVEVSSAVRLFINFSSFFFFHSFLRFWFITLRVRDRPIRAVILVWNHSVQASTGISRIRRDRGPSVCVSVSVWSSDVTEADGPSEFERKVIERISVEIVDIQKRSRKNPRNFREKFESPFNACAHLLSRWPLGRWQSLHPSNAASPFFFLSSILDVSSTAPPCRGWCH